jgi:E3 ubiquitin-protein ligase RAD18
MKPWQVDKHIDTDCPGSPQPQPTKAPPLSKPLGNLSSGTQAVKPLERLPALNYSILKDIALRKKMVELGLSTSGSRQLMERRHKEWVTIWNANCDSAKPKKRSELFHDLEIWERTLGGRASNSSASSQLGAQIKDKDFDGAAWLVKHETSFKDLIANARRTRTQAKSQTSVDDKGGESEEGQDLGKKSSSGEEDTPQGFTEPGMAVVDLTESPARRNRLPESNETPEQRGLIDQGYAEMLPKESVYSSHALQAPSSVTKNHTQDTPSR